jgi:nucleoside-diphosphate-sugar epimerase
MSVLVTAAAGFIGAGLALRLAGVEYTREAPRGPSAHPSVTA